MSKKNSQRLAPFMFLFFNILLVGGANAGQAYTMMGDVNSYERDGYNITFNCENAGERVRQ